MKRLLQYKHSLKYLSESALIITTLLWGATFVIVKGSLTDSSPMLFVAVRFLIASVVMLPFVYKKLIRIDKKTLYRSSLLGVFLFLEFAPQAVGLKYTSATKSGFITGSFVLFTPIMQILIEKKKPASGAIAGSIIVVLGLLFLSAKPAPGSDMFQSVSSLLGDLGGNFNAGDFLTLICAFFFAVQIVYLHKISKEINFLLLTFFQVAVTSLLAFLFSAALSMTNIEPVHFELTGNLVFGLMYTALFASIVTFLLQTRFQREVSPVKAGIIYSFEPVFSAIFAYIMLGERISALGVVGGILIFFGLVTSEVLEYLRQKGTDENEIEVEET
ncbi:MAG: DMT family transporter [Ignavibacteriales bacterium]